MVSRDRAIELSKHDFLFFGKFVRTASGYVLGFTNPNTHSHADLIPDGETATSAGFVGIKDGKEFVLMREPSTTLGLGPDHVADLEGLSKFLGLPGTLHE